MVNRAFIIPNANVGGERKNLVLKSTLGTIIALGLSPDVKVVYNLEGHNKSEEFYNSVSSAIKEKTPGEIERAVMNLSAEYEYTLRILVPQTR